MEDLQVCDRLVCETFPNNDVFWLESVVKFDLDAISELNTESLEDADQNELCGQLACGERKDCCTKLKSCICCCVGW